MQYKILQHEVTGVNGSRHFRGQIVDAESLVAAGIGNLISTKAIEPYVAPVKNEGGDLNKPVDYTKLTKPVLEKLLTERGIDFKDATNNAQKAQLLVDFDAKKTGDAAPAENTSTETEVK